MSTVLLTQITRTGTYPAQIPLDVTYNRGFISFVTNNWTAQMFYELPAIKLDLYTDVEGTMVRSPLFSRTIKTYNPTFPLDQQCSICISMKDVPTNCYLFVTPIFDNNAIEARNELIRNGIETGTLWTTKTNTFSILLSYEDNNSIPTKTITQQPPISFTSDGTSIVSWSMLGNSEQSSTPTPDNPIMPTFCGVRTENLCLVSQSNSIYYAALNKYSVNNNSVTITGEALFGFICKASPNTSYAVSAYADTIEAQLRIREYSDVPTEWSTNFVKQPLNKQLTKYADASFTTDSLTNYILVVFYIPPTVNRINIYNIMLNLGSTVLPYEPYGWAEKITCAGQTTPVYLGEVPTVRRIKKLVLGGTESWESASSSAYRITVTDAQGFNQNIISPVYCSHYVARSYTDVYNGNKYGISVRGGSTESTRGFAISKGEIATVADFKSYLAAQYAAGTPVTVWYVLAEQETAIVNEPLAKIGDYADELHSSDAGVSIPTTKGANTLTVDGTLQPSSMTITGNIK